MDCLNALEQAAGVALPAAPVVVGASTGKVTREVAARWFQGSVFTHLSILESN